MVPLTCNRAVLKKGGGGHKGNLKGIGTNQTLQLPLADLGGCGGSKPHLVDLPKKVI